MRNVGGIAQSDAQKSTDMFYKCRYLDELTDSTGVIFATGTPVSNSMTELYTMMRYLQYDLLYSTGLHHFDSWASTFGETVTAIELAPEGTGYRAKTRFARFFNLPELLSLFKQAADIKTSDMVNLVRPDVEFHTITSEPTEFQKDTVLEFGERAERVRNGAVESSIDNMLKITNDGRKLALDQRLIDPYAEDDEESKVNKCIENAYRIWVESSDFSGTQLIFCDLSTPKNNGEFNVYVDIKEKLIEKGVPAEEIAFIHDANTDARKADLFANVRSGKVRFLLGSTSKMGAGTNVQTKLIALHHIDVPWRPSDISQREGRIIRQGNENKLVHVYRYVTKGTFDSYSWQVIENKQRFIGQIMTSKTPVRSCEDIDEAALSYAEIKALSTGNPYIKEKMDLDIQVSKLRLLKANHRNEIFSLQDLINKKYPTEIANLTQAIKGMKEDLEVYKNAYLAAEEFSMTVNDVVYDNPKDALNELKTEVSKLLPGQSRIVGEYLGFKIQVVYDAFFKKYKFALKNVRTYELSGSLGINRMNSTLEEINQHITVYTDRLKKIETSLANAKVAVLKTFDKEEELQTKSARLAELNILLNMDVKQPEAICGGSDDESEVA